MLSFVIKYPFTLLTTAAIVVLSLMPVPEVPVDIEVPLADKWTHMLMYASLCIILWTEYWRCHRHINLLRHLRDKVLYVTALAIVCPLLLGGLMELLQAYATTYRSGDWLDMAANSIGVGIGTVLGIALGRCIKAR
ncbi:MAG: VanZ family protein [Bacteroidaceae bacterium]|nr:VanZ family protein [Bacteroidaceae bacterium]